MEQQDEEKKIEVYERQRPRSTSSSSLPLDLVSEILLRLPEKSVVRFRCVSKPWSSITTDPYFINLFKTRAPRLLLCINTNDKLFVSLIPQHHQKFEASDKSYSSSQPIERYHMDFPTHVCFFPRESVEGLIGFDELGTPIVWNPSTKQLLTLPKPRMSGSDHNDFSVCLGYDPVGSKHKVMSIPFKGFTDECRVLTLGSAQESWRTVKTNLTVHFPRHLYGPCIKGVVYYLALVRTGGFYVVMSFDVRSEKFDKIQLPPLVVDSLMHMLIAYQGRLACVDTNPNVENGIRLWILEDAEKHNWSSKDFLAPLDHLDTSLRTQCQYHYHLKGITHSGEFIYVEHLVHKRSCVLFYDPVRNSCRRFEFKGIADDDGNFRKYELDVFLDHVESRLSLY